MRLYVGTLYTIENEFDECVQSIKAQSYVHFDHCVLRNLPNKEAHVTLFKSFLAKAGEYDVLVKVDADMILVSDSLFENIVRVLKANEWADVLSIAVHDFFSDQLIWGLNVYRNSVRWDFEKQSLFVDRPEVPIERYLMDDRQLAPAAYHCKNPSPYQAFHYGIHRALKVITPNENEETRSTNNAHWRMLERTWVNFHKTRDIRMGLACLGAELAYTGKFKIGDLDHTNSRMNHVLEKYLSLDYQSLSYEIRKRRFLNWGFLPSQKRKQALCLLRRWSRQSAI